MNLFGPFGASAPWMTPPFNPAASPVGQGVPSMIPPPSGGGVMSRLNSPLSQIGLAILANSPGSGGLRGIGQGVLGYQQQQRDLASEELRRKYMEAQIARMQQPEQDNSPLAVVVGADGKPRYATRSEARGQQPYEPPNSANTPSQIEIFRFYQGLPPDQKAVFDKLTGREQAAYYTQATRVNPDGSTQMGTFDNRSGSYTWQPTVTPPGARVGAEEAARVRAQNQGAIDAKTPATGSFDYIAQRFSDQIPKTTQGGLLGAAGAIGSITDYKDAKSFDNLKEQLSTEIRTIFRIPGEGTLSDREQQQYGIQLPQRGNPREVNEQIIKDLRERVRLRQTTPMGPWSGGNQGGGGNRVRVDANGNVVK